MPFANDVAQVTDGRLAIRIYPPKNVTLVNRAAFDQLDKPMQDAVLKVAAAAEARGWWWSQDKAKWYT
jgi:TRAP-type C4-dicarboxylate transport system substrate-binding protein